MTEEPTAQHSALLRLPAELRNRIYKFVLTSDVLVQVTATSFPEPALLSVSRQIRNEAIKIYYLENSFEIKMLKWDPSPLIRWSRRIHAIHTASAHHAATHRTFLDTLVLCSTQEPNWGNVLAWARLYYHDKTPGFSPPQRLGGNANLDELVVGGIFDSIRALRGQPWSTMEKVLEGQRFILQKIDARWEL